MPSSRCSDSPEPTLRGLFLCRVNRDDSNNAGVVKKCAGEVKALRKLGLQVDMVWLCDRGILCNERLVFAFPFPLLGIPAFKYFFFLFLLHPVIRRKLDFSKYDFFYFRHELAHPAFIRTLAKARRAAPAARLLLEIPTWPYEREKEGLTMWLAYWLDRQWSRRLKIYLDGIVHFGLEQRVLGLPAFPLRNGIDLEQLPVSASVPQPGILRLVAVGNWSFWHGLDRLLLGIAGYYKDKESKWEISLKVAGEGRASASLRQLARSLGLGGRVTFYPALEGRELDELFVDCDLGVGTLAMHRKGIRFDSSLKHREYAARGIPFLLAAEDLDFPAQLPWVHYLPQDDTPLDMNLVIAFHESLGGISGLHGNIRAYAQEHLSWERKFQAILPAFSPAKKSR